MDYKTLVVNLKIIGNLDTGVKINTRNKFFILDPINWYQGLYRGYRRDDRNVTAEKISSLIRETSELFSDKFNVESVGYQTIEEFYVYIGPIIKNAIKGLQFLKLTYETDKTFVAQIEIEIDSLVRLYDNFIRPLDQDQDQDQDQDKVQDQDQQDQNKVHGD
jgi:hypothetical protein